MMKIAIDFREGANPRRAGKGEYVYQLAQAWFEKFPDDQITLLVERGQIAPGTFGNWRIKVVPARGMWWQAWVYLWLEFIRPVDIYFSTTSVILPALVRSLPVVTTIFDFSTWHFPATHFGKAVLFEKIFMSWAIKFSRHLLAISEFTKTELVDRFHVSPNKVTVTPMSYDTRFQPMSVSPQAITSLQAKYHLPNRFILYLGTLEPRKNIGRLIEAFNQIKDQFPDTHLVLAGAQGWSKVLPDPLPARVVVSGYVDDADRPALYNLATVFVFPSLYEGFGMPPLEAMACGVPVITSATASLPEVVADAAILVDPTDAQALAESLVQVLSSSDLREQLRKKGLVRAHQFSWETTLNLTRQAIYKYE